MTQHASIDSQYYTIATGVLLRLMSETECLLSWEGVEGREVTYEAQFKRSGSQDFKQVSIMWRNVHGACSCGSVVSTGLHGQVNIVASTNVTSCMS